MSTVQSLAMVKPSGRVLDSRMQIEGMWVQASPEALCCVLEQDFLCLVLVQPRKTCPDMTEKLLTGT